MEVNFDKFFIASFSELSFTEISIIQDFFAIVKLESTPCVTATRIESADLGLERGNVSAVYYAFLYTYSCSPPAPRLLIRERFDFLDSVNRFGEP